MRVNVRHWIHFQSKKHSKITRWRYLAVSLMQCSIPSALMCAGGILFLLKNADLLKREKKLVEKKISDPKSVA